MASSSKHTEWILETIDHLRRRKARPDLERICHVVRRRFGLAGAETEAKLEKLVDSEIVIKVDYKGSTSYRNAAKWRKSMLGCAVLNSTKVSTKIIEAILELSKSQANETAVHPEGSGENQQVPKMPQFNKHISDSVRKFATEVGVSLENINEWLRANCEGFDNLKSPLTVVLKREIDAGRVKRLFNCNYVITAAQMEEIFQTGIIRPLWINRKSENKPGASVVGDQEGDSAGTSISEESNASSEPKPTSQPSEQVVAPVATTPSVHQPARRGRPPKNRALASPPQSNASSSTTSATATASTSQPPAPGAPTQSKLKRILTSESQNQSQSHDGPERKCAKKTEIKRMPSVEQRVCDFCELTCLSNPKGEPELLLQCKDCTARAHPSCMNYSRLLASRACRGPWQCMDCKTCCLCQDAGDPDLMLFCDGCDKGYHMNCHQPAITKKPSGKWECSECRLENMSLQRSEFMATQGNRPALSHDSAPPTPAESPVPTALVMNGDIHIPTAPICLGDGRYPDASGWSVNDVVDYLTSAGFKEEAKVFQQQEIDGVALLLLKRADVLKGLDLKLGPALKINRHVQGLQTARQQAMS